MAISPETKNWTWVLERACPDCGFDTQSFPAPEVATMLRDNVAEWPALLADPLARLRPSGDQWSALEYGCHVRDVFDIFDGRLGRMLAEEGPTYPNWDQDATAIEERYDLQDPLTVTAELVAAGERIAEHFAAVDGGQWQRIGLRSDGAAFTIESFARYLLHDPVHHVWDVQQGFRSLGG